MKFQDYLKPFSILILLGSMIFFIACTEDTDVPIDDETPTFQIDITKTQDGTEGGAAVIYTINLSEGSSVFTNILDEAVSMSIAFTSGSDADQEDLSTSLPTTVSIPVGSSSATITLEVASDDEEEETETLRATISEASSGTIETASADASITDATVASTADNDVSVLEKYFYTSNTTFVVNETTITITTKDLPDHKSMYYSTDNPLYEAYDEPDNADFKKNPGEIVEQDIVLTIPRFPELDTKHSSPGGGPFGVAINSVVFFNQEAAGDDDIFEELNTFDQYEGHPAGATYHYHIKPVWLTELKGSDAFMGFLLDGFPVYGPFENGEEIFNNDLDDYHGHTSVTADFPNGIYHYHITEEYPWINGDGYYGTPGTKSN